MLQLIIAFKYNRKKYVEKLGILTTRIVLSHLIVVRIYFKQETN